MGHIGGEKQLGLAATTPDQGSNQLQAVQLIVKQGGVLTYSLGKSWCTHFYPGYPPYLSVIGFVLFVPECLLLAVLQQQITVCPQKGMMKEIA